TADMSTMLAQLEAEVGQLVDNAVAVINSTPGDGATVAGTWRLVTFGLGLHDSDSSTSGIQAGTFAMDAGIGTLIITDDGNGDLSIANGAFEDFYTNFTTGPGGTSIYYETDIGVGDDETFGATIDSDGNIQVSFPFEEELQSVDLITDPDGPDFGWRWPPSTHITTDTGNGNVNVLLFREAGIRYATTDTDNDGVNDAVDPNARSGDEVSLGLDMLLKQGSDMSDASLSGDYGVVSMKVGVHTTPSATDLNADVGVMTFDGSGGLSALANALNYVEINRSTSSGVVLIVDNADDPNPLTASYSVSTTGALSLDFGGGNISDGVSSDDGTFFVTISAATTDNGGAPATIVNVDQQIIVGMKLEAATPDLSDAVYRLFPLIASFQDDGVTGLFSVSASSRLTFNSTADSATFSGTDTGFERSHDTAEVAAVVDDEGGDSLFAVTTAGSSAITMTLNDGEDDVNIQGFVSADGKLMVLRVHGEDALDPTLWQDLGIMLAVRQ
ncbi:hypothetical protein MNBD_GAMMA20-1257, partial [hydrothermal vent metagenome]